MDDATKAQVLERIAETRPFGTRLFALLDAARDPRIWPAVRDADEPHECLFAGKLDPELQAAAPYLVELEPEAAFTGWLLTHGWGDSWGLWMAAPADLEALRHHFRHFTMVEDADRKQMYFRFYDPRVWRDYMAVADDSDRGQLFGPIDCFWVENTDPTSALHYYRDVSNAVAIETLSLAGATS